MTERYICVKQILDQMMCGDDMALGDILNKDDGNYKVLVKECNVPGCNFSREKEITVENGMMASTVTEDKGQCEFES